MKRFVVEARKMAFVLLFLLLLLVVVFFLSIIFLISLPLSLSPTSGLIDVPAGGGGGGASWGDLGS